MENEHSRKKYRGIKYIVLAFLFIAAVGFVYFTKGQNPTDSRQAEVKEKAGSMIAGVKEQGEKLMTKAGDIKEGMSDTMAKGRDKVSEAASDLTEKTSQMAKSATESGSEMMDKAKSAAGAAGDRISDAVQTDEVAEQMSKSSDTSATMASRFSSEKDQMVEEAMSDGTQDGGMVKAGMEAGSEEKDRMMEQSASDSTQDSDMVKTGIEAVSGTKDRMMEQAASEGTQDGDMVKAGVEASSSSVAKDRMMEQATSDRVPDSDMAKQASWDDAKNADKTMAGKDQDKATSKPCPYPPAYGKNLGTRYVVAVCETLSIISERTGIGVNDLINNNPQVRNPNLIYPDQELRLPPRG